MDIDPKDLLDSARAAAEQKEARVARLNAAVAVCWRACGRSRL